MKLLKTMFEKFKFLEEKSGGTIYPQMVKEIFHIPTGQAIFFLELATRAGHAKSMYEVRCPTCDRVIGQYRFKYRIPEELQCEAGDDHELFHKADQQKLIQKVYVTHG